MRTTQRAFGGGTPALALLALDALAFIFITYDFEV